MSNALIVLAKGFEDIEAVTAIDVLRRGGVKVTTAALDAPLEVESAHGITMKADALLSDVSSKDWDVVLLPGGPGTERLRASEEVLELLRRQKEEERLIAAICAAPLVLVDAGVLEDEHVTCYPTCSIDLDRPCASVPVVVDGLIATGQAPGSALIFSLVVLQELAGESIARKVARGLVTDVM